MNPKDIQEIVKSLNTHMEDYIRTIVYEHQMHKDNEISTLHREINTKLGNLSQMFSEVKETVDSHDKVIQQLITIYKTGSIFKKIFINVIIGVPSLAAFFGAIIYIYNLVRDKGI